MKKIITVLLFSILFQTSFAQKNTNIVESNNRFSFDIYQKLKKTDENLIFSPASISSAIAMTYLGAKNKTFEEISNAFYFNTDIKEFREDYINLIDFNPAKKNDLQFFSANSLWIQEGLKLNKDFLMTNKQYFSSSINRTDFIKEHEKSRLIINQWVENNTNKKITNLLQPLSIDNTTRLVLVNALYFKGAWKDQFNKEKNTESNFQIGKKEYVKTVYMNRYINSWYYSDKYCQIIDIPYSDEKISLLIILPKSYKDLKKIEKMLSNEYYSNYVQNNEIRRINLTLPKFNIESQFNLNKTLSEMGIKDAFTEKADFSGITEIEKLYISKVVHKSNITIDEEGTEAAAATAVMMSKMAIFLEDVDFNADKPFIYILRNNENNCIYFMGKIINPNL